MRALLFPGQAADSPRMGLDIAASYPRASELLDIASDAADTDLRSLLARGAKLRETRLLQPALVAVSLGALEALRREVPDLSYDVVAGHSLGELSAWCAAGAISPDDAVRLAAKRGAIMQAQADALGFDGGMLALSDLDVDIETVLAAAGAQDIAIAARNGPRDWVLSGPTHILRTVCATHGGKLLSVSGPWHSSAMTPAMAPLAEAVAQFPTGAPTLAAVVSNRTADTVDPSEPMSESLVRQLVHPVAWAGSLDRLAALGVTQIVAVGPGRVIRHQVRRNPSVAALPVLTTDDSRDLARTARALEAHELA